MDLLEKFKHMQKEQYLEFQASQRQDYQQFIAEQEQKYREFQDQQAQQFRKLFQKDLEQHQDESLDNASPTSQTDQWTQKPLPVRRRGRPPRKPQNQSRSPSGESEARNDDLNGSAPREVSTLAALQANSGVQKRRGRPPKLPNLWVNANGDVVRKRGRPPKNPPTPSLLLENHSAIGADEGEVNARGHPPNAPLHDHNYQSRITGVASVTPPFATSAVPTQPRKRGRPRKYPRVEDLAPNNLQAYDGAGEAEEEGVEEKPLPAAHTRSRLDILVQQAQEIIHEDGP